MDHELVNGSVQFSTIEDLMHSSDWKKNVWMDYLFLYGDKKPSDCVCNDLVTKMKAGTFGAYQCPVCKGQRVFTNASYTRPQVCRTCNGFGYFDHEPEPIIQVRGYK